MWEVESTSANDDDEWFDQMVAQYGFDKELGRSEKMKESQPNAGSRMTYCSARKKRSMSTPNNTKTVGGFDGSCKNVSPANYKSTSMERLSPRKGKGEKSRRSNGSPMKNRTRLDIPKTLNLTMSSRRDSGAKKIDHRSLYEASRNIFIDNVGKTKKMFADLRDELDLLTCIHSTEVTNSDSALGQTATFLQSLLRYSSPLDNLFSRLLQVLSNGGLDSRDDLWPSRSLLCMCRLSCLSWILGRHIRQYCGDPSQQNLGQQGCFDRFTTWTDRSDTIHVTLFEMLQHEMMEFLTMIGPVLDASQEDYAKMNAYHLSTDMQRAWIATGHKNEIEMVQFLFGNQDVLENKTIQRGEMFREVCCDVLLSMDQWCPAHPQVIRLFTSANLWEWQRVLGDAKSFEVAVTTANNDSYEGQQKAGHVDSDSSSSGLYSDEPMAAVPQAAKDVLSKVSGDVLQRKDVVERVIRRIIPVQTMSPTGRPKNDSVSSLNTCLTLEQHKTIHDNQGPLTHHEPCVDWAHPKETIVCLAPAQANSKLLNTTETISGIGKTTIAAIVANRADICKQYPDGVVWLSLEQAKGARLSYSNYKQLLEDFLRQIQSNIPHNDSDLRCNVHCEEDIRIPELPEQVNALDERCHIRFPEQVEEGFKSHCFRLVKQFLRKKRVLLILDNVTDMETLRWFRFFADPSEISLCRPLEDTRFSLLLTTNNHTILPAAATVQVDLLTVQEAVEMLTSQSKPPFSDGMIADISNAVASADMRNPTHVAAIKRSIDHHCADIDCKKRTECFLTLCSHLLKNHNNESPGGRSMSDRIFSHCILPLAFPANLGKRTRERSDAVRLCLVAFVTVFCDQGQAMTGSERTSDHDPLVHQVLPRAGLVTIPLPVVDCFFESILGLERKVKIQSNNLNLKDLAICTRKDLVGLGFLHLTKAPARERQRVCSKECSYVRLMHTMYKSYGLSLVEEESSLNCETFQSWLKAFVASLIQSLNTSTDGKFVDGNIFSASNDCRVWEWTTSLHHSPMLDFSLEMLPLIMFMAGMYSPAVGLLRTESFIHDRLFRLGVKHASELFIQEMSYLYTALPRSWNRQRNVEQTYSVFCTILTGLLRHEVSNEESRFEDETKDSKCFRKRQTSNVAEIQMIGEIFLMMGMSLAEKEYWEAAKSFFESSLHAFVHACGTTTEIIATILYDMGVINGIKQHDYNGAIQYLTECLSIRRAIQMNDTGPCAQVLGSLSDMFVYIGEYNDAKRGYTLALDLLMPRPRMHREQIGSLNERMGALYVKFSEWETALKHFQSALLYKQAEFGEESPETYSLYLQIGQCYKEMGQKGSAQDRVETAMTLLKKSQSKNCTSRENSCKHVLLLKMQGMLYHIQGMQAESLETYESALDVVQPHILDIMSTQAMPLTEKRQAASLLHSIGCLHLPSPESSEQALSFFQRSLDTLRNSSGHFILCSMLEVADNLFCMAQVFENQGHLEKALQSLDEALKIRNKYAPESSLVAMTHERIAKVARANRDTTLAQASLQRALELWKKHCNGDENHESVVSVINELSDLIDEIW